MKVAVVYCYPLVKFATYFPLAKRFADTWRKFPPGAPGDLHVICNGAPPHAGDLDSFRGLKYQVHVRDNFGWDIGAFQWAAEHLDCNLLVCLGAPVHFHRAGWLEAMVDAWLNHSPCVCGCWAYLSPNWHIRTTAFWMDPTILQSYHSIVGSDRRSRYEFEHGGKSFTRHCLQLGLDCVMVTWDGCYPFKEWKSHAPGVKNSLVLDQHTHR